MTRTMECDQLLPSQFLLHRGHSLTRDKDVVDVLIVMVDGDGGYAFGPHRGQHTAGSIALARHMQLDGHVHGLLQHRVHSDDTLGERLVAQNCACLVLFTPLKRDEQPIAVPLDKVRVLEAEVQIQIRLHYRRVVVITGELLGRLADVVIDIKVVVQCSTESCDRIYHSSTAAAASTPGHR